MEYKGNPCPATRQYNSCPTAIDAAVRERLDLARRLLIPGPGILVMLDALRTDGWCLGLLTNCSAETATIWSETELASRFDVAIFSSVLGVAKPDAYAYEAVLDELGGLSPPSCVFVGDGASNELAGAQSIGMSAVRLVTALADPHVDTTGWRGQRVNSPVELLALLCSHR